MANLMINFVLVVLIGSLYVTANVNIEVHPDTFNGVTPHEVEISCALDSEDDYSTLVVLLSVSKDGGNPIVFVDEGSQLSYNHEHKSPIKAEGYIGATASESFLKLRLLSPQTSDHGEYTCTAYLQNEHGIVDKQTASTFVEEEGRDIPNIVSVVKDLKDKNDEMEAERDSHNISFSASPSDNFNPHTKEVIQFSKVNHQSGTGFDPNTGIFTASVSGLYSFTLSATMLRGKGVHIDVMRNDETISRLLANNKDNSDQSSVTVLTPLTAGDTVKNIPSYVTSGGVMVNFPFSMFSGYLIRAY